MQRRRVLAVLIVVVFAAGTVALFAWTHGGAMGVRLCEQQGSGGPGTVSWRHLGTTCRGGEPEFTFVRHSPIFAAGFLGMFFVSASALAWLRLSRSPEGA